MLVMKGMLYIFVKPNQESILALSMEKTEKLSQQLIFHKTQLPNTTTKLKNVIPYYSWNNYKCNINNSFPSHHAELFLLLTSNWKVAQMKIDPYFCNLTKF